MSCCCLNSFVFCMWYLLHDSKLYFLHIFLPKTLPYFVCHFFTNLLVCIFVENVPKKTIQTYFQTKEFLFIMLISCKAIQYWSLLNWRKIRFRCGCVAVPVNCIFVVISPFFAIFKNVEHSLEPGETPSNSAPHQAPNYVQHS